ncbi:MAG: 3-dehydroquinate synthase [Lachnospiraceae bacterium]|nr:3-dehydroquinate synthase [Lachnospiraceae bacterium]
MSNRMTINYHEKPCYDIVFSGSFNDLEKELATEVLHTEKRKVCIITDSNVEKLYADEVKAIFEAHSKQTVIFTFTAGEENKTLDVIKKMYTFLIENKFDRKDLLVALGGGVVGDMTGYAAATYLRGVDFMQIPTTLLSQCDSSIGGKTGVDFDGYKNMVGAFYMPKLVYMNMFTLKSLDGRQFASGFAEVMKHGLIKDAKYYSWLIDHMYEINDRDITVLQEMIMHSCSIKKSVVEIDPTEQGERALLNYGHTIGHAIEKEKNFQMFHGECVALGCVAAAFISWQKGYLEMEDYYEIRDMFVPFGLPISVEDIIPEDIVKLTKSDKKMQNGNIKFILLHKLGDAFIDMSVTDEEILSAVQEIYAEGDF